MFYFVESALHELVDSAIAEIAKSQPKTFNEVTLRGLESLKRVELCRFVDGVYVCKAVADKATVSSPEHKDHKVVVTIPISVHLKEGKFEKFVVGEVEVESVEENEDGFFGFWKKVKHAVSKAGKVVKPMLKEAGSVAKQTAQTALNAKAAGLAAKAIGMLG